VRTVRLLPCSRLCSLLSAGAVPRITRSLQHFSRTGHSCSSCLLSDSRKHKASRLNTGCLLSRPGRFLVLSTAIRVSLSSLDRPAQLLHALCFLLSALVNADEQHECRQERKGMEVLVQADLLGSGLCHSGKAHSAACAGWNAYCFGPSSP
jgi:hypothetical protein